MRIVHALCMVTGCALGFAIYRGLTPPLNDDFRSFGQVYNMAMGVSLGLTLTGASHSRRGDVAGRWDGIVSARALAPGVRIGRRAGRRGGGRRLLR